MPKSIWNGTISFGLAHVPVKLYSATESKSVSFHEVHVTRRRPRSSTSGICSKEDKEVPFKEVVKGYEVSAGRVRRARARTRSTPPPARAAR